MAEFLTTNGTSYHIEKIIIDAHKKLILVSPYLQISKTFYERLKEASNKGVSVKIIYGKDELKPNEKKSLAELENVEIFYFENLHAKCYFNENRMVITSMNMYHFSEKHNREMGVLIDREHDKKLFQDAETETLSIIKFSKQIFLNNPVKQLKSNINRREINSGYCIRCETRLQYNPERPYCNECYNKWVLWSNADYEENVCHRCGEYETTTMVKPQCYDCFNDWRQEVM